MTNVLALYEDLHPAGKILSKGGGEYAGPCPSCVGVDRFILWPEHASGAKGGRFLCRGCGAQGDAVAFLREFQGMSYPEACKALRIEMRASTGHAKGKSTAEMWTPSPERLPSAGWMERAAAVVSECAAGVEHGEGLACLKKRGLTIETAHRLGIGWNPADRYDGRSAWGLPEEVKPETGRPCKVWLPRGLVLPIRRKAGIVAVLIRRADWTPEDKKPKYWQVKGSGNGCFCLGAEARPVFVVESLLDAVLIFQEAGDMAAAVALDGSTKQPDAKTADFLRAAPAILWALDFDPAGKKAWDWWRKQFRAMKFPPAKGKDPGEMLEAGLPVHQWVEAGLLKWKRAATSWNLSPSPAAVTTAATLSANVRPDPTAKEELPPTLPKQPTDAPCEAEAAQPDPRQGTQANNALESKGVTLCGACLLWRRVEGLAWWCGECSATGQRVRMKSRCTLPEAENPRQEVKSCA